MPSFTDPIFTDEAAAREHLESIRWPDGPVCPHCGNVNQDSIHKLEGKSHRPGLYQCNECRGHFSVTVGSVMERSKIPLHKWVFAFHLFAASKKGMSAHQLMRMLGLGSYRTAWFMAHRIREAMKEDHGSPIGGEGKTVEADETYFGSRDHVTTRTKHGKPGHKSKRSVVALVERGGQARFFHVKEATAKGVRDVMVRNIDRKSDLYTDESRLYVETGKEFNSHETVHHSAGEYVRGVVHTNTVENVFSVFKRGMRGVYQHCGEAHLFRYVAEFEFRYNRRAALKWSDAERADDLIRLTAGKRLMYSQPSEASYA